MDNSTRGGSRAGGAIIMPVPGPANLPPLPGREAQRQALPVREAQRQINNGVTTIPLEAGNSQDDIFYDAPEYCHLDSLVEVLWQAFVVNSDKDPQAAIYDKTFGKDYKKNLLQYLHEKLPKEVWAKTLQEASAADVQEFLQVLSDGIRERLVVSRRAHDLMAFSNALLFTLPVFLCALAYKGIDNGGFGQDTKDDFWGSYSQMAVPATVMSAIGFFSGLKIAFIQDANNHFTEIQINTIFTILRCIAAGVSKTDEEIISELLAKKQIGSDERRIYEEGTNKYLQIKAFFLRLEEEFLNSQELDSDEKAAYKKVKKALLGEENQVYSEEEFALYNLVKSKLDLFLDERNQELAQGILPNRQQDSSQIQQIKQDYKIYQQIKSDIDAQRILNNKKFIEAIESKLSGDVLDQYKMLEKELEKLHSEQHTEENIRFYSRFLTIAMFAIRSTVLLDKFILLAKNKFRSGAFCESDEGFIPDQGIAISLHLTNFITMMQSFFRDYRDSKRVDVFENQLQRVTDFFNATSLILNQGEANSIIQAMLLKTVNDGLSINFDSHDHSHGHAHQDQEPAHDDRGQAHQDPAHDDHGHAHSHGHAHQEHAQHGHGHGHSHLHCNNPFDCLRMPLRVCYSNIIYAADLAIGGPLRLAHSYVPQSLRTATDAEHKERLDFRKKMEQCQLELRLSVEGNSPSSTASEATLESFHQVAGQVRGDSGQSLV